MVHIRSFVCVEGAEDCAFGAVRWLWVVDAVDQEREAKNIGQEDEFLVSASQQRCSRSDAGFQGLRAAYLSHVGADLSRSSQELKTGHPLLRT